MDDNLPPILDNRFVFVTNLNDNIMSAIVSSYFSDLDTYLPLFLFPKVSVGFLEKFEFSDDDFISRMMGNEASILINNAVARIGGCEYFVFIGLSKHQKSFLKNKFKKTKVIEIDTVDDIEIKLGQLGISKSSYLACKKTEILQGLIEAKRQGRALKIDESAQGVVIADISAKGIVIIERTDEASAVVAINYAYSIGADIRIVDFVSDDEARGVLKFIQKWYREGSYNQLQKVLNKIKRRIEGIDFTKYEFATFFTEGLPYSLYLENCIPCSYVNLGLRPDLFIFNNILFEDIERYHSAIVFSPQFFKDEETNKLIKLLEVNNFDVKTLIGRDATVGSLDFYAPHYPYDIMHICSHGGEVDGYAVTEEFMDRKGVKHKVEYDEVVGFTPVEGTDLIAIHRKTIFKKFDGFDWKSDELRKQKKPNYVFEDMRKAMYQNEKKNKDLKRDPKDLVPTSCAIKCSDSIHQGMFQTLASHSSPFIFNNTCWSWYDVSTYFLAGGAKGYVGTLWAIGNMSAVLGANTFYANAFDKPVINAVHEALGAIKKNGRDKDIYIFWGLHFATFQRALNKSESKYRVFKELMHSFFSWYRKIETTRSEEVRKNSIRIINRIHKEIKGNFGVEQIEKLDKEIEERIGVLPIIATETRDESRSSEGLLTDNISHPVEYLKLK